MKKIVFVSILLVSGLFSLQYTLINNYGWIHDKEVNPASFTPNRPYKYEVIYICPDSLNQDLDHLPPKI